jgi:hypothetical protein
MEKKEIRIENVLRSEKDSQFHNATNLKSYPIISAFHSLL